MHERWEDDHVGFLNATDEIFTQPRTPPNTYETSSDACTTLQPSSPSGLNTPGPSVVTESVLGDSTEKPGSNVTSSEGPALSASSMLPTLRDESWPCTSANFIKETYPLDLALTDVCPVPPEGHRHWGLTWGHLLENDYTSFCDYLSRHPEGYSSPQSLVLQQCLRSREDYNRVVLKAFLL